MMEALIQNLENLWKDWQLRGLLLLSLIFQTILIVMGNHRKYSYQLLVRFAVWVAYLASDTVATMALGIISNDLGDTSDNGKSDANIELHVFWAPFLLLHLGGPDTITAYALEDNELWLRHLLGLALKAGVAFYTYLMAWRGSHLSILSTLMVFVGLSKYVERTWVLRSASSQQIKGSTLVRRDLLGSSNPNLLKEYDVKKEGGCNLIPNRVIDIQLPMETFAFEDNSNSKTNELLKAYGLLQIFKRIFVNLLLTSRHRDSSLAIFQNLSFEKAFKVVEMELAFMYDLLYTKASVVYSRWGLGLRCINLSLTCIVLVLFSLADDKHKYNKADLVITFLLLVLAIVLDIYAALVILFSDWTFVWLSLHKKTSILKAIASIQLFNNPRWSNSMAQFNLLDFALREKPMIYDPILSEVKPHLCHRILKHFKFLGIAEKQEKERYVTKEVIPSTLKEWIFKHLKERAKIKAKVHDTSDVGRQKFGVDIHGHSELKWSVEKGFDERILIWHIATDICYYSEELGEAIPSKRHMSILMSRYMMHLLVNYPAMLQAGIGDILIEDTCAEVIDFCNTPEPPKNKRDTYDKLVKATTGVEFLGRRYSARKSMLMDGSSLARSLNEISNKEEKWSLIADTWVEMLAHAASHCEGSQHRQHLRRGGQLLTHVWLLMAHLGLTDHFQSLQPREISRLTAK
ncbi:uncharacterized protein LOC111318628 [Durio zibethinus]|uniref:Uncharacterized protein LOC111318628 n=1 Tax=Durio zibethinus TaxID=66656 RepID=A0A6P6BJD6_DURZI|nr:uncharacterized protein LOC111318628 [Durio zibethinus]XP_022777237.1 uncharacterized protein LOC111318628 [Durio zibethinus]